MLDRQAPCGSELGGVLEGRDRSAVGAGRRRRVGPQDSRDAVCASGPSSGTVPGRSP
jgi:hypothetical protein